MVKLSVKTRMACTQHRTGNCSTEEEILNSLASELIINRSKVSKKNNWFLMKGWIANPTFDVLPLPERFVHL